MNTSLAIKTAKDKEIPPRIKINPQITHTQKGPIESDLTEGNGPVILSLHGGIGGRDQRRLMAACIDTKIPHLSYRHLDRVSWEQPL